MNVKYAGFWVRALAAAIDSFLLVIFALIFDLALSYGSAKGLLPAITPGRGLNSKNPDFTNLVIQLKVFAIYVVGFLYYGIAQGILGKTVGKKILGLKLVNKKFANIGLPKGIWRCFMQLPSALLFGLGYLMVLFGKEKRGLHDLLSGTWVVYEKSLHIKQTKSSTANLKLKNAPKSAA